MSTDCPEIISSLESVQMSGFIILYFAKRNQSKTKTKPNQTYCSLQNKTRPPNQNKSKNDFSSCAWHEFSIWLKLSGHSLLIISAFYARLTHFCSNAVLCETKPKEILMSKIHAVIKLPPPPPPPLPHNGPSLVFFFHWKHHAKSTVSPNESCDEHVVYFQR